MISEFSKKHPLRILKGKNKGQMPHELDAEAFEKWMLLNGMNKKIYDRNLILAEIFINKNEESGNKVVTTGRLTPDQKGWAMLDWPRHWNSGCKWIINPQKPFRPSPEPAYELFRSRATIRLNCDCIKIGKESENKIYGTAFNGRILVQCQICKIVTAS